MATAEQMARRRSSESAEDRARRLADARDRNRRRSRDYVNASTRAWRAKYPERYRRSRRIAESARRARKLDQFIENVDPAVVYGMNGGMCGICKEFVSEADFHVDHVIPLAKGGMHGYVNVQPAHPRCNLSKGCQGAP